MLLASVSVVADEKPGPRLITVAGEAEINVAPDEVVFDVSVQTINKDLRQAKNQTDERLKKLMELTRKYKI
ncbi:MAG: SIMPL domain-containing protein, partial [Acidobacteriota bacterium]